MATPPTGPMDWPISLTSDDYWGTEIDCDICGDQIAGAGAYTLDLVLQNLALHIPYCVSTSAFAIRYLGAGQ